MAKIAHAVMKAGGAGGSTRKIYEIGVHDSVSTSQDIHPLYTVDFNVALYNSLSNAQKTALKHTAIYLSIATNQLHPAGWVCGPPFFNGPYYDRPTDVWGQSGADKIYGVARPSPCGTLKSVFEYGVRNPASPATDRTNLFKITQNGALYNAQYNQYNPSTPGYDAGLDPLVSVDETKFYLLMDLVTVYGLKTNVHQFAVSDPPALPI